MERKTPEEFSELWALAGLARALNLRRTRWPFELVPNFIIAPSACTFCQTPPNSLFLFYCQYLICCIPKTLMKTSCLFWSLLKWLNILAFTAGKTNTHRLKRKNAEFHWMPLIMQFQGQHQNETISLGKVNNFIIKPLAIWDINSFCIFNHFWWRWIFHSSKDLINIWNFLNVNLHYDNGELS